MRRRSWTTLAAGLLVLAFASPAVAADGDLDLSFAGDGVSHLERGGWPSAVAIQPGGKIIVAGTTSPGTTHVGRLNSDGSVDTTFGDGGFTTLTAYWVNIAVQPDGRIVGAVAGGADDLFRLTADGELDTSFSGDGFASLDIGGDDIDPAALTVQPDGRVLAAGTLHVANGCCHLAVARLNPDGSLDSTFAGDGTTTEDFGFSEGLAITLQGDRIVVAGRSGAPALEHMRLVAVRLLADGTRDASFGDAGRFVVQGKIFVEEVVGTPDGGVLFAGFGNDAMRLFKLDASGKPDEAFGDGGLWIEESVSSAEGVAVTPDGNYTAVGTSFVGQEPPSQRLAAVKVSPSGQLVPSFGDGGRAVYDGIGPFQAWDAVLQPDGKLVIGGTDEDETMAVARIQGPPPPPEPPTPPQTTRSSLPVLNLAAAGPVIEGQLALFTATLSRATDQPVSVGFVTGEGTAATGLDFGGRRGTITIPPGQTQATIGIATNADFFYEPADEQFRVELFDPVNARFGEYVAFATIVNDLRTGRCRNVVVGNPRSDILTGSSAGDLIVGRADGDVLFGLGGHDCIRGERGHDIIDAGDGDDLVDGGSGNDEMKGGDGDDRLYGRRGVNRYNGGPGDDRIYARNGRSEIVECGPGRDTVKADRNDRFRRCEIIAR